jgi:hypothetical protein
MGRADSYRISRVPQYSGYINMKSALFRLQDFHLLRPDFPDSSTILRFFDFTRRLQPPASYPHDTKNTTLAGFDMSYGLGSSRFARHYSGNLFDFSSCGYLDVSLPHVRLRLTTHDPTLLGPGCPIRISTVLRLCAPTRGFSQLTTSFIASSCLGIHHVLCIT